MLARTPIKRRSKAKPAAMKRFHGWVALLSCTGCGAYPVEVHHVRWDGYKGISKDDRLVAPLCPDCHRNAPFAVHRTSHHAYNQLFSIDLHARALDLWSKFNEA